MNARVLWLNGPFGVGKTSTARLVAASLAGSRLYDPEPLGVLLHRARLSGPSHSDFQHIEAWRRWTARAVRRRARFAAGPVVVPMTVYRPAYLDDLLGLLVDHRVDVVHITLMADAEQIRARLRRREGRLGGWAEARIERCLAALRHPRFEPHLWTDGLSPAEVSARVVSLWGAGRS